MAVSPLFVIFSERKLCPAYLTESIKKGCSFSAKSNTSFCSVIEIVIASEESVQLPLSAFAMTE